MLEPTPVLFGRDRPDKIESLFRILMSSERFFPVTILGGRLHIRGIPEWLPWESSRLEFWPESDLDRIIPATGDRKVRTAEELQAVMQEPRGPAPTRKVWIYEGLEDEARRLWETQARQNVSPK
jgi:hypothetical protein